MKVLYCTYFAVSPGLGHDLNEFGNITDGWSSKVFHRYHRPLECRECIVGGNFVMRQGNEMINALLDEKIHLVSGLGPTHAGQFVLHHPGKVDGSLQIKRYAS